MTFPVAAAEPAAIPGRDTSGRPRVLVCDDSSTTRALMRSLLEPVYDILLTRNAEEALQHAVAFGPDVILSDLLLPGMSGSALCRAVRGIPALAAVPFVVVTMLTDADARANGLEAGADDYLAKPIRERELLARVASLVRLRRLHVALEDRTRTLEAVNRKLEDVREDLLRAERLAAVGALAAGLSHEINNPLAYIKAGASAFAALLREVEEAANVALSRAPNDPALRARLSDALEEAREIAASLADGSRRLERVAADLRVVSSPARSALELTDPAEAIDAAWTLARSRFSTLPRLERSIELGPPVRGTHAVVTQALLPMFEHAVLAAGPGGTVTVRLLQRESGAEIAIGDSGPGLAPSVLAHLFDPCFAALPGGAPGGLGLSISQGIVRGLGGDVTVAVEPVTGTTFRALLPRGLATP